MQPEMVDKLLHLNQDFYATYARSFAATRHSVQPGVQRLLPQIIQAEIVLDLGCGNGNLAELLMSEGFQGSYFGIDENAFFLEQGQTATQDAASGSLTFRQGSLANAEWLDLVDEADAICSFAALHHLPGENLHRQMFSAVSRMLSPKGCFYLSLLAGAWKSASRKPRGSLEPFGGRHTPAFGRRSVVGLAGRSRQTRKTALRASFQLLRTAWTWRGTKTPL